ncbi:MAG: glycosyltransferase [Amylibacter sp.]|nr:glycosyltransferase [Amylibacter sp.]
MPRSVTHLKIVPNTTEVDISAAAQKPRLGTILVSKNWVTEGDLLKAWSIQRVEQAYIGEILIGMGKITIDQLYWALSVQYNLDIIDLNKCPPSTNWVDFSDPQSSLKHGYIIWRNTKQGLTIALSNPNSMGKLREMFRKSSKIINFVLLKPQCLQDFIMSDQSKRLQEAALVNCPAHMSCRSWARSIKSYIWGGIIFFIACAGFIFIAPAKLLLMLLTLVFAALIMLMGFRITCLLALRIQVEKPSLSQRPQALIKRPKVSILLPLFKETAILERLVARMQALAYPKELLEICFVYEENDPKTKAALEGLELPYYMKIIEVPKGDLQTKPRAMNYALDFCSGSIIGIYDAEDAPEINQIEQVIQKFAVSGNDVACIQCILDFYNTDTNWMSRCFTIEYAILFRVILPALDKLKLPIPLGGTSVFFRRDVLEDIGRWDAYNVTEDADLGYRLYRMGYRCSWINTVTYEEANYRLLPWIKQRSRWLKGLFLTAYVHMRNPVELHKKIGIYAILTMLSLSVVPWIICPLALIILPMWLLSFGVGLPIYTELPIWFINTLTVTFIATEIMSLILGYKATYSSHHKHLRPWLPTIIFYWPIAFLASYKALFEVFVRPEYWDKSEHGLNDQLYAKDIHKLTRNSGSPTGY